jgi:hypothetical protein
MRPIFTQSNETKLLVDLFIRMPVGASMSFTDASTSVGFIVKSTLPSYQTAKRIAERDHNVVVDGVRGFGFVRINGSGMVSRAPRFFKKVRRGARREAHVQEIALMQNLPREEMMRATEQFSRLRILETTAIGAKAAQSNKRVVAEPPR